jgi:hypothetical protein
MSIGDIIVIYKTEAIVGTISKLSININTVLIGGEKYF